MESQEDEYVPHLGMEFQSVDEAWSFWNNNSGRMGFGARKGYEHKSPKDGVITSKVFYCRKEGERGEDKRDDLTKNPRAKTRTDCKVCLQIKFVRGSQKYKVINFVSEHNHPLHKPEARYLIPSQRKVPEVAHIDIHLANSSRIKPREAHELHSRQNGGVRGIGYTYEDHKNCLRDMRKKAMEYGSAIAMTRYFTRRSLENPSFKHFEDTNEKGEIANVIWIDAIMIADYARFGDVVIFYTTFGTNHDKWACGVFVGLNHFREIVIFGAALMCNQDAKSFEWVFSKFLEAHGGKKPITIFTDQDSAMGIALENVMPDTKHALCVWHINKNCQKKLACYGMNLTGDFSACMFKYEEEADFEVAFNELKGKLGEDISWLKFIYGCKEKWAYCYMRHAFTLGIHSTQTSESINADLKDYLSCKLDIYQFLENFDSILDKKREKEIQSDYNMTEKLPRIKMHLPILCEAGKLYTPKIFELFQAEFELSGWAQIGSKDGNMYTVEMIDFDNETQWKNRQVIWNRDEKTISCSCKKFERVGILCSHALKVLWHEDIKSIPSKYILARWTQEAKKDAVVDVEGRIVIEDSMLQVRNRRGDLNREIGPTMDKAASCEERTKFLRMKFREIVEEYEEVFENRPKRTNENGAPENSLHLKKKDGDRRSKRKHPWNEKLGKRKKGKDQSTTNSQPSSRPSTNISQGIIEKNFGCYDNLEDRHDLEIMQ